MDEAPYTLETEDGNHRVVNASGRTICSTPDPRNAQHYLTLLNEAYRSGYRDGYRRGKAAAS